MENKNKKDPPKSSLDEIKSVEFVKNVFQKYKKVNIDYRTSLDYQKGKGIMSYFSPQELLKRFELLGGSLAAGNNGVLPEYIQIAHRLKDLGIVTNKQLNSLLRNYLSKGTYGSPTTPPFLQKII